jgi:hypothetical protein
VADWAELADLLADSYRLTAPKRLLPALDGAPRNRPPSGGDLPSGDGTKTEGPAACVTESGARAYFPAIQ